jgi:hypothetical protein
VGYERRFLCIASKCPVVSPGAVGIGSGLRMLCPVILRWSVILPSLAPWCV